MLPDAKVQCAGFTSLNSCSHLAGRLMSKNTQDGPGQLLPVGKSKLEDIQKVNNFADLLNELHVFDYSHICRLLVNILVLLPIGHRKTGTEIITI